MSYDDEKVSTAFARHQDRKMLSRGIFPEEETYQASESEAGKPCASCKRTIALGDTLARVPATKINGKLFHARIVCEAYAHLRKGNK